MKTSGSTGQVATKKQRYSRDTSNSKAVRPGDTSPASRGESTQGKGHVKLLQCPAECSGGKSEGFRDSFEVAGRYG